MSDFLTARDRCDHGGCNAAAYVVTGALLWCAHHYSVHSDALLAAGWSVDIDERHRLASKPRRCGVCGEAPIIERKGSTR